MKNSDFVIEFLSFADPEDGGTRRICEIMLNRPDWWVQDIVAIVKRSIIAIHSIYNDIWRDD